MSFSLGQGWTTQNPKTLDERSCAGFGLSECYHFTQGRENVSTGRWWNRMGRDASDYPNTCSKKVLALLATVNSTSVPRALKCSRPQSIFACSVGRSASLKRLPLDSTTK